MPSTASQVVSTCFDALTRRDLGAMAAAERPTAQLEAAAG